MITYSLQGQSALVTGADSGIGEAVAIALAAAGANVIINHVDAHEEAQKTVDKITAAGGNAYARLEVCRHDHAAMEHGDRH